MMAHIDAYGPYLLIMFLVLTSVGVSGEGGI